MFKAGVINLPRNGRWDSVVTEGRSVGASADCDRRDFGGLCSDVRNRLGHGVVKPPSMTSWLPVM